VEIGDWSVLYRSPLLTPEGVSHLERRAWITPSCSAFLTQSSIKSLLIPKDNVPLKAPEEPTLGPSLVDNLLAFNPHIYLSRNFTVVLYLKHFHFQVKNKKNYSRDSRFSTLCASTGDPFYPPVIGF
jgi:hypothetical protein